jgi:hypothetical protein
MMYLITKRGIGMISSSYLTLIEEIGLSDKEFRKKLSEVGNAFVDWRYVYEQESISLDVDFLRRLSEVAQKYQQHLAHET